MPVREPEKHVWDASSRQWNTFLREREEQVFLVLTLLIGALVGLVVVAFILLTERFGARLYPAGGSAWRRLLVPVACGPPSWDICSIAFFPMLGGVEFRKRKPPFMHGVAESRWARCAEKFSAPPRLLPAEFRSGREGPAVQVGAGIASLLGRRLGLRPEK